MAKKKETEEHLAVQVAPTPQVVEVFDTVITPTPTPVVEYPYKDKVLEFREKGFDNNRIAALLGIQKHFVDGVK